MMTMRTKLIAALTAGVLAVPAAAIGAPKQLSANDKPQVSGPLTTNGGLQGCNKRTERHKGEAVARLHICNGYYIFDPDEESNAAADYGAYWVQGTVDAVNGWCTRSVVTELDGGGNGVTKRSPKPGTTLKTNKGRKVTPKIKVDAEGNTDSPATIKNTFRLRPGTLKSRKNGSKFRLTWTGKSRRKLAFVMGNEIQWETGESPPTFTPQVFAQFEKRDNC
jgi:hypothetical protein